MLEVNGQSYQLMLLDTNIVSEVSKNEHGELNKLIDLMVQQQILPVVTVPTLFELRKRADIFEKFLDVFSLVPFILAKPQNQVAEAEMDSYPVPEVEGIIAYSFSFANPDPNGQVRPFLTRLFNDSDIQRTEREWENRWKREAADSILKLRDNFKPSKEGANATDAHRFLALSLPQYIFLTYPDWANSNIHNLEAVQASGFPSIQSMLLNVYYRFYDKHRKWEQNEIFDILITSIAGYVDIVVTENFQAEIFRKIKNMGGKFTHLHIETLAYLRV